MLEYVANLPVWLLVLIIFVMRIVEMSLDAMRTIATVDGRIRRAAGLGFFQVLVWILVAAQVINHVQEQPILALAYAAGFAGGSAVGIWLEKKLAYGRVVLRMITSRAGSEIAAALRAGGQAATVFAGEGRDGPVSLLYVLCPRRGTAALLATARKIDPELFFVVEKAQDWGRRGSP